MAASCSSMALRPSQTHLSLMKGIIQDIIQVVLFQVYGIKNETQGIFISMDKGGYFLATELLAFHLCQWDFSL